MPGLPGECPGVLGIAREPWEFCSGAKADAGVQLQPRPCVQEGPWKWPGVLGNCSGGLGTDLSKVSRGPLRGSRGALWASRGGLGASLRAWGLLGFLDASRRFLGASWGILGAS